MSRPIFALLTDFGLRDHYVAAMKAVVLGICDEAAFVDITHDIAPQDVVSAALELAACFAYFPPNTIFVVVVDPGVGSARRAIAAEGGGYRFVGPDNGVLSLALEQTTGLRIVELTEPRYARETVSRTFEGRDRFAPAAAWLATGVALDKFGPEIGQCVALHLPEPSIRGDLLAGEVLRVDRFGNLITNITRRALEAFLDGRPGRVGAAWQRELPFVSTYADVKVGDACTLLGSSDFLEVAVNGGSAAERLAAGRGTPVHVRRGA
jgi:S-adenosylmethionine hydrolase